MRSIFAALLLWASLAAASAQSYPSHPIKLIVPFPAGGPADVMGRLIAQHLSTAIGQVIVENRPGAGSTLAGRQVATADPDGYTLLLASSGPLAIGPALYPNPGYDPRTSFAPVGLVSETPYVMIGAMDAPFKNVKELLAYDKAHPGILNFGVPNGAPPHMLAEMFNARTAAHIEIVPYRGASTLITDILAGRIQTGFETTSVMFGHLHDGKIRGLAVLREQRLPQLPDVPTMIESGVEGVAGSSWIGIVAPAGTPNEIVTRIHNEIALGVRTPEFAARLKMLGAEGRQMTPAEFGTFIAAEYDRIGAIMKQANVKSQ
jgi:tripartite-type tricarboxylate transporter receptor subunit TctC